MLRTATALAVLAIAALTAAKPPPAASARPPSPELARQVVLVLDRGTVHRRVDLVDPAAALSDRPPRTPPPAPVARSTRSRTAGLAPRTPQPARAAPSTRTARAPARTRPRFAAAVDRLLAAGSIDQAKHDHYRKSLLDAQRSLGRLRGTRRDELGAVLGNLEQIAAAGEVTASRLPGLVVTLERNRQWWTTGQLLSDGQRVGFAGSQLVWEYYAGQGIEIQWLGTFGKANGYFLSGRTHDGELTALLDEALRLATDRAGGLAWEYDFNFDGGAPPWVSSLAQGTAIQALSRAAVRFTRADYFDAAHSGLGVFETPPPEGVRVATTAGAHYLIYSFAPHERVLNAFIQSLVGLYDYAGLANSDDGRALFAAGQAEASLEVPHYDTGAWSLYDQSTESDLSYHTLLRDFLGHLCDRLRAPAASQAPSTTPGPSGGTPPAPPPTQAPPAASAAVYCTAADHFTAYLGQPPVLAVAPVGAGQAGRVAGLRLTLSKISLVTVSVRQGTRTVYRLNQQFAHGTRALRWRPDRPGSYRLSASATDLAGNAGAAPGATVTVSQPRKHR